MDLTTSDGSAELVGQAVERFGGLDLLVNNVGAVRPRLDGFLAVHRRGLSCGRCTVNYLVGRAYDPGGPPPPGPARALEHRDGLLGQRRACPTPG